MKNNIVVVFSSHLSNEENQEFIRHIKLTIGNVKYKTVYYTNLNQFSLSEIYNKAIGEHYTEKGIMIFLHNDLEIRTHNWGRILLNHFNNSDYGIIGVAGSSYTNGVWWSDFSKAYGIVSHTNGISEWVSEYSQTIKGIQPVVTIDGLFMAVDCDKIKHKFDENYGKFHFYDQSFAVPNYLSNVNIGVITNIRILHKSIGQTNDSWNENRQKFEEEYKDTLPIKYIVENKLRVLICCQFFKNFTGSEMSNYELSKELVKLGCDVTIISSVVGEPLLSKAQKNGVNVYSYANLPNFIINEKNQFQFIKNEKEFDIIHINHKPIGELILQLYPNTPAVMHVRSEVIPIYEEPIIDPTIKRYISIRESITDYIKTFGVEDEQIIEIDNPFDSSRFNCDYLQTKNEKEVILFVGTLDYLRKNIIIDLLSVVKENNQMLWIIGEDNGGYIYDLLESTSMEFVRYFRVKPNVEDYIKKCDYTAGIFKGRTTIEGFLCGKSGWVYTVDKEGNIINKEFQQVPLDVEKYNSKISTKKVFNLYNNVIDEHWGL